MNACAHSSSFSCWSYWHYVQIHVFCVLDLFCVYMRALYVQARVLQGDYDIMSTKCFAGLVEHQGETE